MRIGVTFTVRQADATSPHAASLSENAAGYLPLPRDDAQEEFDSPETIAAMAQALESLGHEVELLGDGELMLHRLLAGPRPDLVWNIAEGHGGGRCREARVPAVLEMLGIPYTGSDPLTLAATLDKDCAKRLVAASGVATPAWLLYAGDWQTIQTDLARIRFPVFVKPAFEGSSKGILDNSIIPDADSLRAALAQLHDVYAQPVLVEEYIEGDELTVGLVGNGTPEILGIMRVLPRNAGAEPFVYSLEVKRDWQRRVRYECPALLAPEATAAVQQAVLAAWKALGCRDVSRMDFRLRDGVPYFLETNPLPGLSPISGDLVILSGLAGIEYRELITRILRATTERCGLQRVGTHERNVDNPRSCEALILYNEPSAESMSDEAGVLESVDAVAEALTARGHRVASLGLSQAQPESLQRLLRDMPQRQVVFNLFEGFSGVGRGEAEVTGLLELFNRPFTGSPAACLSLVRDKPRTKWLLAGAGLLTPEFVVLDAAGEDNVDRLAALLREGPVIVKPAHEDASLGISTRSIITDDLSQLLEQVAEVRRQFGSVLVERFIPGREFNIAIVALPTPEVLPLAEIEFSGAGQPGWQIVTYEAKWAIGSAADRQTPVRCPARVDDELGQRIRQAALAAFSLCACRDYARVDLRVDEQQRVYILEVNGNPDIGPSAGFARALRAGGIAYESFIERLVEQAAARPISETNAAPERNLSAVAR